jgi:23S rRNA (adenine2503-C2)-methyltransferase
MGLSHLRNGFAVPGRSTRKYTGGIGHQQGNRPVELLGLSPEDARSQLERFVQDIGAPSYRATQVEEWLLQHLAHDFGEMTNVPEPLRRELAGAFSLTPLETAYEAVSRDGTVKHLWALSDGEQVESVLIPSRDRLTLCISSQAGCALGCRFCATGYFGFRRQLRASEIVAQYRDASRVAHERFGRPISNIVFMGMGEPMANLGAVNSALDVLHRGFRVGARRITVSTVGLVPGILDLARRPEPFALAVSLHAPTQVLRMELVPAARRYPLPELMRAVREFARHKGRRVTFEYTLIADVNDQLPLADTLADLLHGLLCYVNLIPFNPIPSVDWRPSAPAHVQRFADRLAAHGIAAGVRTPRGRDIAAACGQLRLARDAGEALEAEPTEAEVEAG